MATPTPLSAKKLATPPKAALERLMVVFDYNMAGHIVFCQGQYIEPEAVEHSDIAYHTILAPDDVEAGTLRVYEVEPSFKDGLWWHTGGKWRQPNAINEIAAFLTGAYPGIWKDIPHGEQYDARMTASIEARMDKLRGAGGE